MRLLDKYRLAKLSLVSRGKTTFQGIFGLSFGMILLFPLMFLVIGFYGGFNTELNNEPTYRAQRVDYSSVKTVEGQVLCDEQYESDINKIYGITSTIKFNYCYLLNERNDEAMFSINGGEKFSAIKPSTRQSPYAYLGIEILDKKYASRPFLDFDYNFYGKPLIAGRTFSASKSEKEVMVSNTFLRDYGLNAKSIIGSTLSVYSHVKESRLAYSSSRDEIIKPAEYKENVLIANFIDFKIVGVYDSGIYYRRSPRTVAARFELRNENPRSKPPKDYFWITTASLGENGVASAPEKIFKEMKVDNELKGYDTWYYYEDTPSNLSHKITSSGYAFIPFGLGVFSRAIFNPLYTNSQLIDFYNFQTARNGYEKVMKLYKKSVTGNPEAPSYKYQEDIVPKRFEKYQEFYDRFIYVSIGLGSFGGIIFIATLLNITNTMHFAVDSAKGFIGICRAQGMNKKTVRKLFLSQVNLIFIVSYIFAFIFGGAGCIAIKLLFDKEVQGIVWDDTKMELTLRWFYIPVSLAVLIVITTIISITISKILVRKINKKGIIDVLIKGSEM